MGAGSFHIRQIREAVAALRGEVEMQQKGSSSQHPGESATAVSGTGGGVMTPWVTKKRYAAFISHHQRDSAMEARYLKEQLEGMLGGAEIFLDFDNLQDLQVLLQHVRESDVLVLLLTSEVLLRPWCILEIHAAVSAGVPIVGVTLRGKGYDHGEAHRQLTFLDTELERLNPGALGVLRENGLDPVDGAYLLANVVPRLVTLEIDPAASRGALQGGLSDLVDRMRGAQPPEVAVPKAEWLEARSKMTISAEVEATKAA